MELKYKAQKRKFYCILCLAMIYTGNSNSHQMVAVTTQNNISDTKTRINDLLDTDDLLFLKAELPILDAKASFLLNADTGQVLHSEDGEIAVPMLSVTKALSAYVILDKLKEGSDKFTWDTKIKAEGKPVLVSYEYGFSNVSLYEGSEYSVRELFEAMMINSANGVTMLLAEYIAGSEKEFVELMKQKANSLGLKQVEIYTSTGLTKSDLVSFGYEDLDMGENKMSPANLAFMTTSLLKEYPEVLSITSKTKSTFAALTENPFEYETTNALLPSLKYEYGGVTGLKTGGDIYDYTSSIIFTATQNDINLIGVILGGRNSDVRAEESKKLLDYGFKTLQHKTFIDETSVLFSDGTVKIKYGNKAKMAVTVDKKFVLSTSFNDLKPKFEFIPTNSKYNKKKNVFEGQFRKGEVLGKVVVTFEDLVFLTDTTEEKYSVNLIANEDIENGFFLLNGFDWLKDKIFE